MNRRLAGQTYFDGDLLYFAEAAGAVADPPAKTDPAPAKTEAAADPTAAGGTASASEGAPPDASGKPADAAAAGAAEGTPPEPTSTELAIAASRKADAVRMATRLGLEGDYATVEDVETAITAADEEARLAALDNEVSASYTNTLRTIVTNLKGLTETYLDDSSNEATRQLLTDKQIQDLVAGPINGLQTAIRAIERDDSFNLLADAFINLLPDDAFPAWEKAAEGGKPIGPWMEIALEHAAPHTKWARQQAADHAAAIAKAHDEGFAEGAGAPKGTVSQSGGTSPAPVIVAGKSVAEQAALLASGEANFATEAAKLGAHA